MATSDWTWSTRSTQFLLLFFFHTAFVCVHCLPSDSSSRHPLHRPSTLLVRETRGLVGWWCRNKSPEKKKKLNFSTIVDGRVRTKEGKKKTTTTHCVNAAIFFFWRLPLLLFFDNDDDVTYDRFKLCNKEQQIKKFFLRKRNEINPKSMRESLPYVSLRTLILYYLVSTTSTRLECLYFVRPDAPPT